MYKIKNKLFLKTWKINGSKIRRENKMINIYQIKK